MKEFGFDLLRTQAINEVSSEIDMMISGCSGPLGSAWESEIEKLFDVALNLRIQYTFSEVRELLYVRDDNLATWKDKNPPATLLMQRQVTVPDVGRVDFLIHCYAYWPRLPEPKSECWRTLAVECDGHNFHERTKEQAARDRARDRNLQMRGIEVFRFTGSELWRDPWGCAGQVIEWAEAGI